MATKPAELVRKCGINRVYAWQLLRGDREPSLKLALQIYDETGDQLGKLKGLTPDEIQKVRELLREIGKLAA
jgi:transcriptional regulator with XRE-family HTH domain